MSKHGSSLHPEDDSFESHDTTADGGSHFQSMAQAPKGGGAHPNYGGGDGDGDGGGYGGGGYGGYGGYSGGYGAGGYSQVATQGITQQQYNTDAPDATLTVGKPTSTQLNFAGAFTQDADGTYHTNSFVDVDNDGTYSRMQPTNQGTLNISVTQDGDGNVTSYSATSSPRD